VRTIVNGLLLADGKVLLARRSLQRKAYAGLWSFPGGHVEPGETLEQALVRELREEIGIVPITYDAIGTIPDPNAPAIYHLYAVTRWDGMPTIQDEEHSELRWFAPSIAARLSDLALDEYRPLFERLTSTAL
jgi:8-oxo-dGTP diphosphatase